MGQPEEIEIRKVAMRPFECYFLAKGFLGENYWLLFGITFVALMLGGMVPLVLIGPAYAGIAICLIAQAKEEPVLFEDLFKGFDYFGPSLIASLVYVGGVAVLAIPFLVALMAGVMMKGLPDASFMILGVLLICMSLGYFMLVVSISMMVFIFAIFLIVDKKIDGWPAIKYAMRGVIRNFWGIVWSSLAGQLIYFVGAMLCLFPALLTIPVIVAGHFIAYWKIYGLQSSGVVTAQEV